MYITSGSTGGGYNVRCYRAEDIIVSEIVKGYTLCGMKTDKKGREAKNQGYKGDIAGVRCGCGMWDKYDIPGSREITLQRDRESERTVATKSEANSGACCVPCDSGVRQRGRARLRPGHQDHALRAAGCAVWGFAEGSAIEGDLEREEEEHSMRCSTPLAQSHRRRDVEDGQCVGTRCGTRSSSAGTSACCRFAVRRCFCEWTSRQYGRQQRLAGNVVR